VLYGYSREGETMKDKDLVEIDKRIKYVELGIKKLDKSIRDLKLELIKSRKEIMEALAYVKTADDSK
jgi:hypothetical protein